jgi:hypothetical protein
LTPHCCMASDSLVSLVWRLLRDAVAIVEAGTATI